jgi:hypothetical protein
LYIIFKMDKNILNVKFCEVLNVNYVYRIFFYECQHEAWKVRVYCT